MKNILKKIRGGIEMKCLTKKEEAAFVLYYSDYEKSGELEVSWEDLRRSEIGVVMTPHTDRSCGRAVHDESAKIVYKDEKGVAVLFEGDGTTDDPDPEYITVDPILMWYEFA